MPRSSDYLVEGYTYHLTHRCHNSEFLLKFARDRDAYRDWLREGVARHGVPVYGYCLTSNHVHLVVHASDVHAVSELVHLAAGSTAKEYNVRKERLGSMWQHPYHCTRVQDGSHLFNCLCYVDMNAVRAGLVEHPREWRWCGYSELMGTRKRYRFLDVARLLESLDMGDEKAFRESYGEAVERRLGNSPLMREAHWTESLAVGSRDFVESTKGQYAGRRKYEIEQVSDMDSAWYVKEPPPAPYGSV